jgi:copper transporter 1
MLFNWETTNLCIIFHRWQIQSTTGLIVSLILIILITAGYEALREFCRLYEAWTTKNLDSVPSKPAPACV